MKNSRIHSSTVSLISILFMLIALPTRLFASDNSIDFYASLRTGAEHIEASDPKDGANGRDFLSRVGVKGDTQIAPQITGLAHIEYGLRSSNLTDIEQNGQSTLRLAYGGLQGKFGTVYYGSQTLVWHKFVRTAYFSDGLDTIRQGTIRDDDLLQYYFDGDSFSLGIGLQMEAQDGDSFDQFQLGGEYRFNAIKLQAAYSKDQRGIHTGDLFGLRAWWTLNPHWLLSAYTHHASQDYDLYTGSATGTVQLLGDTLESNQKGIIGCVMEKRSSTGLYAQYRYKKHKIHSRYAIDSCKNLGDVRSIKTEYTYSFNPQFNVWLAYENLNNDRLRAPTTPSGEDMSSLQLGIRVDL